PPHLHALSLHDALPISRARTSSPAFVAGCVRFSRRASRPRRFHPTRPGRTDPGSRSSSGNLALLCDRDPPAWSGDLSLQLGLARSEEHTSELQSPYDLV